MPKIRTYHGNAGTQLHEVTEEEYAVIVAQYSELKARAERAVDSPGEASTEDLEAARQCYELAYRLGRDEERPNLKDIMDRADNLLRERRIREDQERREAAAREAEVIRAIEEIEKNVGILANVDPDAISPAMPGKTIKPEELVDADLERESIVPERAHKHLQEQKARLQSCLDVIKNGIPANARKRATEYIEGLLRRDAELDLAHVINLAAINAESNRRKAEIWQEEQARDEVENLPETVADLRERLASLEAKL